MSSEPSQVSMFDYYAPKPIPQLLENALVHYRNWKLLGTSVDKGWDSLTPNEKQVWRSSFEQMFKDGTKGDTAHKQEQWLKFFYASPHESPQAKADYADQALAEYAKRFYP